MAQPTKYSYELTISSSPHIHAPVTTQVIMAEVLIALTPALLGAVAYFGLRALTVTLSRRGGTAACACGRAMPASMRSGSGCTRSSCPMPWAMSWTPR